MGARGPQPKPQALKELEGNPGKKALNRSAPQALGEVVCPDTVKGYGRTVWRRIVDSMPEEIYGAADIELLAAYCLAVERFHEANAEIDRNRYGGEDGRPSKWFQVMAQQATLIAQLGGRLGLDPASRSSINVPDKRPTSKFAGLIGINGGRSA